MSELREALESAVNSAAGESTSVETSQSTIPTVPDPAVPPSDDSTSATESGDQETEDDGSDVSTKEDSDQPNTPASEAAKIQSRVDRAPSSWKGSGKQAWAALPLDVRQEVHRREREFQKYIHETGTARNVYEQMGKILEPHMETFNAAQVHPLGVINELLNQGRVLWDGSPEDKAKTVAKIISDCQVDVSILDQVLSSQMKAKQDPTVSFVQELLQKELAPIKASLGQQFQPAQQPQPVNQVETAVMTELEQFANAHPYFFDVKDDMADIMEMAAKRGQNLTLEDAYTRAIKINDIGIQQPTPPKPNNLSIGGAPNAGALGNNVDSSDLRGTIANAFNNMRI